MFYFSGGYKRVCRSQKVKVMLCRFYNLISNHHIILMLSMQKQELLTRPNCNPKIIANFLEIHTEEGAQSS